MITVPSGAEGRGAAAPPTRSGAAGASHDNHSGRLTRVVSEAPLRMKSGEGTGLTQRGSAGSVAKGLRDVRMELTWINKLRIVGVAVLGMVLIGILAWPLAAPYDPLMPVRAGSIGVSGTIVLLLLAFAVGLAGYFVAWPHGREIGILGVPFALSAWAVRSGPMQTLTQALDKPAEREALLDSLRFEPVYWLLVVASGFLGVLAAQHLVMWTAFRLRSTGGSAPASKGGAREAETPSAKAPPGEMRTHHKPVHYVNVAIALLVAVPVATLFVGAFAQDLCLSGQAVAAQPAVGQIVFAVIAAFAVTAFLVKKFLGLGYLWPAFATCLVLPLSDAIYADAKTIALFAQTEPAAFYPHAVFTILPLQLVALGVLGAVTGYWLAVRYNYWRQHQSAP